MSSGFFGKNVAYDPVNNATGGNAFKYLDPLGNALFGGYKKPGSGPGTPGPYAGVTPTLADSSTGYAYAPGANGTGATYKASSGTPMNYDPNNQAASMNPYVTASIRANALPGAVAPGGLPVQKTTQPVSGGQPYGI